MVNFCNWDNFQQSKLLRIALFSKDTFFVLVFLSFSLSILLPAQIVLADKTIFTAESGSEDKLDSPAKKKIYKPIGQEGGLVMQTTTRRLPLGVLLLLLKQKKIHYTDVPARALIGPEGGTLYAFGADGRAFRLTIPPNAILGPAVLVSIQPLENIKRLPISGEPLAGVRLEPEGLKVSAPVTLEVRLHQSVKKSQLLAVSTSTSGDDSFFVPPIITEPEVQELSLQLYHFSLLWVGKGEPSDIENHNFNVPPSDIDQLTEDIAYWTAELYNEYITQEEFDERIDPLIWDYYIDDVIPAFTTSSPFYKCKDLEDMTQPLAEWLGHKRYSVSQANFDTGLEEIRTVIPKNTKEDLKKELDSLAEKCREINEFPSCEAEDIIKRVELCSSHANYLSGLLDTDLNLVPDLTNLCPGHPAAIRIDPKRYSVCTGGSFHFKGWLEDSAGTFLSPLVFPITYNSTNELIMTVGSDWEVNGLRPGEADLLATAGCKLEERRPIRVGVVNLVGKWVIEGTEIVQGCQDLDDDGEYPGKGTVTIDWQHENGKGEAFIGGKISGQSFTGIVNCYGLFDGSGSYTHKDDGWCYDENGHRFECDVTGKDSIKGVVTSSSGYRLGEGVARKIDVTTESKDETGDTCTSEGTGEMSRSYFGQ